MSVTASAIATFLNAELCGRDMDLVGVSPLGNLTPGTLTFMTAPNEARVAALVAIGPICAIVGQSGNAYPFTHIVVGNPRMAFARAVGEFFQTKPPHSIAPSALVDPEASIGRNVNIGPYSVIEAGVTLGDDTFVGPYTHIKRGVSIGRSCYLKGHNMLGQEGFGFEQDGDTNWQRVPHIGGIEIGDNVELGAFTAVACGTIEPTRIGRNTKVDDHVLVGHNSQIGENNIIAGGVIISGGVRSGHHVWFGPNACMMQGIVIEDHATIGVGAVMFGKAKAGTAYAARPSLPGAPPPAD